MSCWAVATGTTINALTSSRPTVRMASVTVTAASTAITAVEQPTSSTTDSSVAHSQPTASPGTITATAPSTPMSWPPMTDWPRPRWTR